MFNPLDSNPKDSPILRKIPSRYHLDSMGQWQMDFDGSKLTKADITGKSDAKIY